MQSIIPFIEKLKNQDWKLKEDISELPTPSYVANLSVILKNCDFMLDLCKSRGVRKLFQFKLLLKFFKGKFETSY